MLPPSTNKLYKYYTIRKGRKSIVNRRLSNEAEKFKAQAGIELGRQWMFLTPPPDNTPLEVTLTFYFPHLQHKGWPKSAASRYKRQDVDNYVKLLLDVVKEACGVDDSNVMALHAYKKVDSENPRIEIDVGVLDEPDTS